MNIKILRLDNHFMAKCGNLCGYGGSEAEAIGHLLLSYKKHFNVESVAYDRSHETTFYYALMKGVTDEL